MLRHLGGGAHSHVLFVWKNINHWCSKKKRIYTIYLSYFPGEKKQTNCFGDRCSKSMLVNEKTQWLMTIHPVNTAQLLSKDIAREVQSPRPHHSSMHQNSALVGGLNPSEKYESQLGWLFPIYGKIKHGNQTTNQSCFHLDCDWSGASNQSLCWPPAWLASSACWLLEATADFCPIQGALA